MDATGTVRVVIDSEMLERIWEILETTWKKECEKICSSYGDVPDGSADIVMSTYRVHSKDLEAADEFSRLTMHVRTRFIESVLAHFANRPNRRWSPWEVNVMALRRAEYGPGLRVYVKICRGALTKRDAIIKNVGLMFTRDDGQYKEDDFQEANFNYKVSFIVSETGTVHSSLLILKED